MSLRARQMLLSEYPLASERSASRNSDRAAAFDPRSASLARKRKRPAITRGAPR
jgi:hypothetical protein